MATINNPVLNRALSEQVRPMAERARGLLILAQASAAGLAQLTASLAGSDDADVIDDGRLAEGVPPLTVGQFRAATALLGDLVAQINADPRLPAVLSACVRSVEVN